MKKDSSLIIFLMVIIAPVLIETSGDVLIIILSALYGDALNVNSLLFALADRFCKLSILALYCVFLLKLYKVKPTKRRQNTGFFICIALIFLSHFASYFSTIASNNLYFLNVIFARARDGIDQTIKYAFEVIPTVRLEISATEVIKPPTFIAAPSFDEYICKFVTSVLFAPLFEEFVLRYCMLRIACRRFGMISGLLLSSVSFAIMHKYGDVITHALLFGIVLGSIYILSDFKIWVPILAHFLHNFLVKMDELQRLVKKANFPIGFPTDTETAYQFAINTEFAIDILSILATLILVMVSLKKLFSFGRRGTRITQKIPVAF